MIAPAKVGGLVAGAPAKWNDSKRATACPNRLTAARRPRSADRHRDTRRGRRVLERRQLPLLVRGSTLGVVRRGSTDARVRTRSRGADDETASVAQASG